MAAMYMVIQARVWPQGVISFEQVGPLLSKQVVTIAYQKAVLNGKILKGNIPVLDVQYGNVWTNIPDTLFNRLNLHYGDMVNVSIFCQQGACLQGTMPYSQTFGEVAKGDRWLI